MSGSMALLQLGSVMMSVACVSTRDHAMLSQLRPSPALGSCAWLDIAAGELAPPHREKPSCRPFPNPLPPSLLPFHPYPLLPVLRKDDPTPLPHVTSTAVGREDSAPCLDRTVELALLKWVRVTPESRRTGPAPYCRLHCMSSLKQCWRVCPGSDDEGKLAD